MNHRATPPPGRGARINPPNRFETVWYEEDYEHSEDAAADYEAARRPPTEYLPDDSRTIISENDSPDLAFRYSLNPYRGCQHGCSYCYARPSHEYLGLNAGLDFEAKIFVKHRAPQLFQDWLAREKWEPELIAFSGITDCYQPAEREFRLTRSCLEIARDACQPIGIVTKNALVCRDLDVLQPMARQNVAHVSLSVTTLDAELARVMEPRTSTPAARLRAIRELSAAGIPVSVMVAPVIPGLNDHEIPAILEAAADAGAVAAGYVLLRLPLTVRPVFLEWLERTQPSRYDRVVSGIEATRGGKLNSSEFGKRMRGEGIIAEQIRQTFQVFSRRHGLSRRQRDLNVTAFQRPQPSSGQLRLF
ncbi:PA0069 family radical SAM protein [Maioricimonas sp. JC845]|uniref:PA0069 family radical SAM protein n=1 Tax=Maioricimonas sp. JC845 TaxID=3232138 RepID=UPI00345B43A6